MPVRHPSLVLFILEFCPGVLSWSIFERAERQPPTSSQPPEVFLAGRRQNASVLAFYLRLFLIKRLLSSSLILEFYLGVLSRIFTLEFFILAVVCCSSILEFSLGVSS